MDDLVATVGRMVERRELQRRTGIFGESAAIQEVLVKIEQMAPVSSTVLIQGESGTGKELVAKAIHDLSPRRGRPFIAVNCAALPETLLESELFGHEKGAFTGAAERRLGRFELADTGTIFLDEIGEIPSSVQVKLLRVLETRSFFRLGGVQPIKVDVRVVAATNRALKDRVARGEFRDDLFYRLNVLSIYLPPLRERRDDVPLLIKRFVREFTTQHERNFPGIATDAMERLMQAPWPGNVRQLENVVKRMLLLAHGYAITEDVARAALTQGPTGASAEAAGRTLVVLCEEALARARREPGAGAIASVFGAVERELLAQAHATTAGNITQMAQLLGWSRLTVREKLKLHGLRSETAGDTGETEPGGEPR
jgi:DNA-binding NtrC family response regulator